ncbi:MAG: DegV family protein [Candidatus Heimdallarchaeota archaeon]|nr:DegV family protein [Candidatus Heimdallarchaeota archaeon]
MFIKKSNIMKKIKIVVDSTCDLDLELAEKYDIALVPFSIIIGEKLYKENVTITKEEFYQMMQTTKHHPKTGLPQPKEFYEIFEKFLKEGREIICLTISGAFSGTYNSATVSSKMLIPEKIHIIDSRNSTLGLGLLTIEAAKLAEKGSSVKEIVKHLQEIIPKTRTLAMAGTLEWLQKGGRIGKAQWLVGSLLGYKPFIGIEDGVVTGFGRTRGIESAMETLKFVGLKALKDPNVQILMVGYTTLPEAAEELLKYFQEKAPKKEVILTRLGAALGTQVGPGCFGLSWIGKFDKNWLKNTS